MTKISNGIKDIKNQQLKNIYKKYTDHIVNFEKHICKLFNDWVIDINDRNNLLRELDNMVKITIKIYNSHLMKILQNSEESDADDTKIICNQTCLKSIQDNMSLVDILERNKKSSFEASTSTWSKSDPFIEIKNELLRLSKDNGIVSIHEFFCLYISEKYPSFLSKEDRENFDLYNKVFVPLSISIEKLSKKSNIPTFHVVQSNYGYDGLMDNTCQIIIRSEILQIKFIFDGYISSDLLNIYIRTSQIYSRYLFNIKKETKALLNKNHPDLDDNFLTKYSKQTNSGCYFVNNPKQLSKKIALDYHKFNDLVAKNFNVVIKEFVNSDVKIMFNTINLLLMGDEQNISTAVLLFNLLKGKKSSEVLSDIIYHNLSYYSQIKLRKASRSLKNEIARVKTLTPDNVSLEKRLGSMINMPDNVKSYIIEKNNEIKTGENNYKLQMAINGLMAFPWKPRDAKNDFADIKNSMVKSRDYLKNVAKKLDQTVYGHETSKKVLIELVGKWIQNPESSGQVIGLVGPPGVGKTLLAKSISVALGIPLSIVGLGGMSDSADLIGHSFTYAGAQYGMIVRQMIKAGQWRSVMFFDEVDKVSKRNDTNEIYNTLLHITDQNMNQHFQDRFYSSSIEFDLSGLLIVFSYNDSSKLDPILLDRIKEINISAYALQEKISIAQNYIMNELCENIGFNRSKIHFDDDVIKYIIEKYTLEAGVRELRRKLEQILLKLNIDRFYMRGPFRQLMRKKYSEISGRCEIDNSPEVSDQVADSKNSLTSYVQHKTSKFEEYLDSTTLNKIFNLEFDDKIIVDQKLVHKYLEKPIMLVEEVHHSNMVGVINGLYATSIGMGGIVPIQIYKNYIGDTCDETNLKLKITGNQKQVMRESVICALTAAVNILNSIIKSEIMKRFPYGFHIHAPDGGTPKDGPSAGCAFTTAFISVLLGKKVNRLVAMTGEIELTGKVSKIGGLDTKLAGAKKAGVKCVYICEENKEDYETIKKKNPDLFCDEFQIRIINHIIDIVTDPNVIVGVTKDDFDQNILAEHEQSKKFVKNLTK